MKTQQIGFSIRFPKLKEEAQISVSCSEPEKVTSGFIYISLPIHIESNKPIASLIYDEDRAPAYTLNVNVVEESEYANLFPMISIPYYDKAVNESNELVMAIIKHDGKDANKDVLFSTISFDKKVSRAYFYNLLENWILQTDDIKLENFSE